MDNWKELLIGCGNSRLRRVSLSDDPETDLSEAVTLDMDAGCNPDYQWDLNRLPLPFARGTFDRIHAYDVLEHCGMQGDWRFFFRQFDDFHRVLKTGGRVCAIVPRWDQCWAWGDPGHTRVIPLQSLQYLCDESYEQVGVTAMTDYRDWKRGDWRVLWMREEEEVAAFVLEAK